MITMDKIKSIQEHFQNVHSNTDEELYIYHTISTLQQEALNHTQHLISLLHALDDISCNQLRVKDGMKYFNFKEGVPIEELYELEFNLRQLDDLDGIKIIDKESVYE